MANANTSKKERMDRLFSKLVRERDRCCRYCHAPMDPRDLTCHHFVRKRGWDKVRWMFENAIAVCWWCHPVLEDNPLVNDAFAVATLGEARYWEIREIARETRTKVDLDAVWEDLKGMAA